MVEEVFENIFRIEVVLPGNPLKATNAYLIRGAERDLLIDTGFRRKECFDALSEGLKSLGSHRARRDVLCTHLHADHSGLADLFAAEDGTIWFGAADLDRWGKIYDTEYRRKNRTRFLEEGFPLEILDKVYAVNPAFVQALPATDARFRTIRGGDCVPAGDHVLTMIDVPGHTPGNGMFWMEDGGIMFTGDHVLFDITPNITAWTGMDDALGSYIDSLERVRDYPVKLALPGHRKPGDYLTRINAIIAHHARRLDDAMNTIREEPGLTGYDIAGLMRWKIRAKNWAEFPPTQKWFAVGECFSHLDYLRKRGRITRRKEDGLYRYYAV